MGQIYDWSLIVTHGPLCSLEYLLCDSPNNYIQGVRDLGRWSKLKLYGELSNQWLYIGCYDCVDKNVIQPIQWADNIKLKVKEFVSCQ